MFRVNNRNTRTSCEIWSKITRHQNDANGVILAPLLLTYFTPCSSVSAVNFGQVNAGWERINEFKTNFLIKQKRVSQLVYIAYQSTSFRMSKTSVLSNIKVHFRAFLMQPLNKVWSNEFAENILF